MQNKNQVVIYGRHAVGAALNNPQRKNRAGDVPERKRCRT